MFKISEKKNLFHNLISVSLKLWDGRIFRTLWLENSWPIISETHLHRKSTEKSSSRCQSMLIHSEVSIVPMYCAKLLHGILIIKLHIAYWVSVISTINKIYVNSARLAGLFIIQPKYMTRSNQYYVQIEKYKI